MKNPDPNSIKLYRKIVTLALFLALGSSALAKDSRHTSQAAMPSVFIEAENGFDVAIAAAITKKHTPVEVTTDRDRATLILHSSGVNQKVNDDKTGTRVAKAMFGIPTILPANVSVQLVELDGNVLWAYNCVKAQHPNRNVQSLSEAIAKHLKEYLESKQARSNAHY